MIVIIPARGGSKRLPGKNIKLLNGKPLIAYTIEAALESSAVSRVIVSTDDADIRRIAIEYGAECPFLRPKHLSLDNTTSMDVIKFVVDDLEAKEGIYLDEVAILQPTSPFRNFEDINKAVEIFKNNNADSVISYCKEHHPIKWHKYITNTGKFEEIDGLSKERESRVSYFPNGAIYILKRDLVSSKKYYTNNSYVYVMSRDKSLDIDTIDDFNYASFLLNQS